MRNETHFKSIVFSIVIVFSFSACAIAGTWQQFNKPGAYYTSPCGIDGSKIVGQYRSSSVARFLYDGSTWTDLQMPSGEWSTGVRWALGIYGNRIVGTCSNSSGTYRGYIYDGSNWNIINAPGASDTWAYDTYGSSTVGYYYLSGNVHGFIYNGSQWQTLDKPGASQTFPNGIDGSNTVGRFNDSLGSHGFIFNGNKWETLNMPGALETEVRNSSGNNFIGCYLAPDHIYRSFIYNSGSWTTLDAPWAVKGTYVSSISGNTIVGSYLDASSNSHGFIYTVPEPTTLLLFGLGAAILRKKARN